MILYVWLLHRLSILKKKKWIDLKKNSRVKPSLLPVCSPYVFAPIVAALLPLCLLPLWLPPIAFTSIQPDQQHDLGRPRHFLDTLHTPKARRTFCGLNPTRGWSRTPTTTYEPPPPPPPPDHLRVEAATAAAQQEYVHSFPVQYLFHFSSRHCAAVMHNQCTVSATVTVMYLVCINSNSSVLVVPFAWYLMLKKLTVYTRYNSMPPWQWAFLSFYRVVFLMIDDLIAFMLQLTVEWQNTWNLLQYLLFSLCFHGFCSPFCRVSDSRKKQKTKDMVSSVTDRCTC